MDSIEHWHFPYNEFCLPGDTPSTNSLEQKHLTMKGSKETAGLCSFGLSLQSMITQEFPRMVNLLSSRAGFLEYHLRIRDVTALSLDTKLMKQVSRLTLNDFFHKEGSMEEQTYLANSVEFIGTPINEARFSKWLKACQGTLDSDHLT